MPELRENPYAAPVAPLDPDDRAVPSRWLRAWVAVFGVNLIAPLFFGSMETRGIGWLGVLAGVVFLLILSVRWLGRSERHRTPLLVGGIGVAIAQVVPVFQIIAGMLAILVREIALEGHMGPPDDGGPLVATFPAGLMVTVLTGGMLLIMADSIGWVFLTLGTAGMKRLSS
jgi:hypothetical protein